jgi:hypothetical protein
MNVYSMKKASGNIGTWKRPYDFAARDAKGRPTKERIVGVQLLAYDEDAFDRGEEVTFTKIDCIATTDSGKTGIVMKRWVDTK